MQRQEYWIANTTSNSWYLKLNTFPQNVTLHDENSIFGVATALLLPIALMLHDCAMQDMNMTLLWWMGVVEGKYQFIRSPWGFLSMVTPWFISKIDNTSIWK